MSRTNAKEPNALKSVEPHQGSPLPLLASTKTITTHANPLAWQEIARVLFVACCGGCDVVCGAVNESIHHCGWRDLHDGRWLSDLP